MNALGDKSKLCASGHLQWWPRMMGQNEDRRVIGRLLAPPSSPTLIRPRASDGAEHIPTQNPGAESGETQLGNFVIDARFAIAVSIHSSPYAGVKKPFHQLRAIDAERMRKILIWSGAIAVDRDPETSHEGFRHDVSFKSASACLVRAW